MFENRISSQFDSNMGLPAQTPAWPGQQQILPMVSLDNIYQAAAERAARDAELDRLFNPDFYHDNGSGI